MKGDDFLKELHTNDLSMNSGKLFREQMIENFEAIEQVINDIYGEIDKMKKQDQEDKNFFNDLYK